MDGNAMEGLTPLFPTFIRCIELYWDVHDALFIPKQDQETPWSNLHITKIHKILKQAAERMTASKQQTRDPLKNNVPSVGIMTFTDSVTIWNWPNYLSINLKHVNYANIMKYSVIYLLMNLKHDVSNMFSQVLSERNLRGHLYRRFLGFPDRAIVGPTAEHLWCSIPPGTNIPGRGQMGLASYWLNAAHENQQHWQSAINRSNWEWFLLVSIVMIWRPARFCFASGSLLVGFSIHRLETW